MSALVERGAGTVPTIFIVEEDLAVRDSLTVLVQAFGYKARAYADARAFLAAPERRERGCLLLGWPLPNYGFASLMRELASEGSTLRAVAMTAREDEKTRDKALAAGAALVLPKPFDDATLFSAIGDALGSVRLP